MSEREQMAAEKARIDRENLERERLAREQQKVEPKVTVPKPVISTEKVEVSPVIAEQAELNPLTKISQTFEAQFQKVDTAISNSIADSRARALEAKRAGKPVETAVNFALATGQQVIKGGFAGVTFVVRPEQWKNTANSISKLLTPTTGETQEEYDLRVTQFLVNDLQDPVERANAQKVILDAIPAPPSGASKEQRKNAEIYRAAVVEAILDDPIAFIAETAGGLAGGYIASKIISKLPDSIKNLTPKSLEQRAFDKLRPLDSVDDVLGLEVAIGENPATLLPNGKWSKLNSWVPKNRRGSTSIILLVDPVTKAIEGFISLADAQKMTGGIPELLTTIGGLQAIPVIKIDEDIAKTDLDSLNEIHQSKFNLISEDVQDQLEEDNSILLGLAEHGVIVLPELDESIIEDTDIINIIDEKSTTTPKQVQPQVQEQAQEQPLEQVQKPILEEQPIKVPRLRKKDKIERTKLNLRLLRGRKQKYRVTFHFNTTTQETKTVEARSFPEAVQKAQRKRRPRKKQPILVDVVKLAR